jgi:hypothetical protein
MNSETAKLGWITADGSEHSEPLIVEEFKCAHIGCQMKCIRFAPESVKAELDKRWFCDEHE